MWTRNRTVNGLGALGVSVLLLTWGCGSSDELAATTLGARDRLAMQTALAPEASAGDTVLVTCEPRQQTLVRQAVVNGRTVAHVECVTTGQALSPAVYGSYGPSGPGYGDVRVVPTATSYAEPAPRVVAQRRVVREAPRPADRSWKKSAIIIGSSAGVGAGVGAAVGGKKGALIGAAIGGGGAAIWDQATRR
jgi:hypothetical protein